MGIYVGLDVGGTKFMAAAADQTGRMLRRTRAPAPLDLQEGLDLLKSMTIQVADGQSIKAIGASLGGPLDWRTGIVSPLHQPAWRNVRFKEIFENSFHCPCCLDVDTNLAALGEYRSWSTQVNGPQPDRLLYITISTGMGGGFLVDGKIYRGADGAHPEIAHQSIHFHCQHPERIECECGLPDCLEGLVSGNAIRRIYSKPAEALDDEEWHEVAFNLGQGLRNLATIYSPSVIILGGGVATGRGQNLIDQSGQVMRNYLRLVPPPRLVISHLGYDTSLVGAIFVAIHGID